MRVTKSVKMIVFILLTIVCVTLSTSSFAATNSTVSLKLVEDNVCTIDLDGKASLEKKLTKFDANNKSATLTLTVTNTMQNDISQKDMEVFFVIDNSSSMVENTIDGVTRKAKVIEAANALADKLFAVNSKAQIGIVSFSSLDSVKGETEGTINDAKLELDLSNSKEDVKAAIAGIDATVCGPRTNIQAGLQVAANNLSDLDNMSRYIVLLTDGVPNNDVTGNFGTYVGQVGANTKATIEKLQNENGIEILGAMIGLDSEKEETSSGKTYQALAEEVFGTVENPTITKYYYITDESIEKTITEDIYNGLTTVTPKDLTDLVIKDYFPQEIIDNFNFEYVEDPNLGTVTTEVNKEDNSITWTIEKLSSGQTASLSYVLTLKDDFDKTIIDKVLPTNSNVEFSAKDGDTSIEKSSDVSPTVQVVAESKVVDNTIADKKIPQTGEVSSIVFVLIAGLIIASIVIGIRYVKLNK